MRERTRTYRVAMALNRPVAWWGRLKVDGLDSLPSTGPLLVVGNHDSHWDPLMVGMAALRRRQIRALAKSTLWDVRGLGPILTGWARSRSSGAQEMPGRLRGRSRLSERGPASASFQRALAHAGRSFEPAAGSVALRSRCRRHTSPWSRSRVHPTSPASLTGPGSESASSTLPAARHSRERRRVNCRLGGSPRSES